MDKIDSLQSPHRSTLGSSLAEDNYLCDPQAVPVNYGYKVPYTYTYLVAKLPTWADAT